MVMESKEFQRSFSHSDTERLSRSDEVLKLKNFKKDAALKPFKSTNQERSVETEFPAIVFNDNLTSNETLFCEPTVSSLNDNEIDFRILFDEFDDEDYMVVFDKNSFSYKIISANHLKTDSENDNEKVNMPLFPSPEPSVSCIDDLDFFKDFENEFPAIVYNDASNSKSDFSTEPTLCPQHIDEFDLKDETSLSKYDEVEQNVLYFMPQILMMVLKLFQHPYMCPHQLQVGLCPRDWGDLRRRYRGYVRMLGVCEDLWRDR
ncbi:hypothetical protein Tco_0602471 [Tanacetum coccineum]